MQGTKRVIEYDLLRVVLVSLVVIGHSSFYTIVTPFGGIDYLSIMRQSCINDPSLHIIQKLITKWIYTFHMPLFISLSGVVFSLQLESGRFNNINDLIKNKAKKLLVPFIVVWFFWNVPIKYVSGYYEGHTFKDVCLQVLFPGSVYLWYLESLFIIFVIIYFIFMIKNRSVQRVVVAIVWLLGLYLMVGAGEKHFLGDPLYYLPWFYLGMNIDKITRIINKRFYRKKVIACAFVVLHIILFSLEIVFNNRLINASLNHIILPLIMVVATYIILDTISVRHVREVESISSYSMGIYLYAEPINYLMLHLVYKYFGIVIFGSEWFAGIFYLSRIIITTAIALCITRFLKMTNIKYLY